LLNSSQPAGERRCHSHAVRPDSTAVTSTATYYDRTGPCCTNADQHYYKVTMTLSGARLGPKGYCGAPDFTRMVITGKGFRTERYTYQVVCYSGHVTEASWLGGVAG
jgi:hypothetical protein